MSEATAASWVVPNQSTMAPLYPYEVTEYRYDHDADEWVEVTE